MQKPLKWFLHIATKNIFNFPFSTLNINQNIKYSCRNVERFGFMIYSKANILKTIIRSRK